MKKLQKGDRVAVLLASREDFGDEVDPHSLRLEWLTVFAVSRSAIGPEHDVYQMSHADGTITEFDPKYLIQDAGALEKRFQAILAEVRKKTRVK
jgi:hypothetical protein